METLKLEKETAKKLYPESPKWFQEVLINTFGKKFFSKNIIDRVKTYEDAYLEADEETRMDCETFPTDTEDVIAYKKLKLIANVLRGDWVPDWNNSGQNKWFPYLRYSSGSGFVFSYSACNCACANSLVGSRLCFPTEELSDYFGKQFIDIHNQILIINK